MGKKYRFYLCVSIGMAFQLFAKDFGALGETFPIEEESLLSFLQSKLSTQIYAEKELEVKKAMREKARNPKPLEEIKHATKSRSHFVDPSIKVPKDILDSRGTVLVKAGTVVNPLEKIDLSSGLLLLDGSMRSHLSWARSQGGNFKWILVKGHPIEVEEAEKRPIYFDQTGISSHFKIENYPARIIQKGKFLLVEEIAVDEGGNPL